MLNDGDDTVDVEGGRLLKRVVSLGGGRGVVGCHEDDDEEEEEEGGGEREEERRESMEFYIINYGAHISKKIKVESLGTLL